MHLTMWHPNVHHAATFRRAGLARWRTLGLLFLGLLFVGTVHPDEAAADDYRLGTGDVLRVSVYGEPVYPLQVTVDPAGIITLPLLGEVKAQGQSVRNLVKSIEAAFRERELLLDPFVQVDIAEYRPFFISGAVAQPGAYPYKPGMSVRHALAIAGGFKAVRIGDKAPSLTIADIRSDQVERIIDIFRYEVQLERLRAELRDSSSFSPPAKIPVELAPEVVADIISSEEAQLQVRRADFDRQVRELQAVIAEAAREVESISRARSNKEMVTADQLKEVETARQLKSKALIKNSDLLAAERGYNNYLAELAQLEVQDSKKQQDLLGLESEVEKLTAARKVAIISQIQEAQMAMAKAQNKANFLAQQLTFVSTYGEQNSLDDLRNVVRITIHRPSDNKSIRLMADEDSPVEAGDILDVAILLNNNFDASGSSAALTTQSAD
ncbi:polysaccharide biosynthesis/export family protein [Mesorhizobium sp. M1338]|uniref:polysaccharide biosynthesis/export family protein n=1 Tax=unclassified Mesorhizobium TaxID=325217 RepID=UPI00333C59DE